MTDVDYRLTLTPEQRRFFTLIESFNFASLWDMKTRELSLEGVNSYLATASHGEAVLLRFLVGVWLHKNDFEFDLLEAAKTLDANSMKIITDWLSDPFWP